MIQIKIFKDKKGNIVKYNISGHSGYAEIGSDIVCAAVSSVTQSAILGLTQILKLKIGFDICDDLEDPFLECILPKNMDDDMQQKANIILDTMLLTLKEFKEQYSDYIDILEQEV